MAEIDDDRPDIGHNNPPPDLRVGEALSSHLETDYAEDLARTKEILEKGRKYLVIENDEQDQKATEFMVSVRKSYSDAEAGRVKEKRPYDDAAGIVQAFFKKRILDPLGLAADNKRDFDPQARDDLGLGPRINMAQTRYKVAKAEVERKEREAAEQAARAAEAVARAEADRLANEAAEAARAAARKRNVDAIAAANAEAARTAAAAEEARIAEQKASEARAAAQTQANAPMSSMSRARGNLGGVSSLKTFVDFRDVDREKIDLEKLRPYLDDKALQKAVKGWIDANKGAAQTAIKTKTQPITGVVIFEAYLNAGRA